LSSKNKVLYNYFRQLFAQVTNPPIDPIRESIVMSLITYIGPRPNLLDINQINPPLRLEVVQPILDFMDIERLKNIHHFTKNKFKSKVLNTCFPVEWGSEGIEAQLSSLCAAAADAVRDGFNILILSDKSISADSAAMPALLALSSVHQHLIKEGLRTQTGLVVETGSAREVHHFAVLAGYGAEAVHPYVALETIKDIAPNFSKEITEDEAIKNYIKAIGKGFSKIMSKMGISTYMSYCGAQIFETVGINKDTIDKYFSGTSSAVEGVGVFEIAEEALLVHKKAFEDSIKPEHILDVGGEYEWRVRGEQHMWTPDAIAKLQHSVRGNDWSSYEEFAQIINNQNERHMTLRGLFSFKIDDSKSIPIDEVEPATEIVKRFATGAMSLGSISTEAHVGLAIAMNRLGGKSNTGEGGEDKFRYRSEMLGKNSIKNGSLLSEMLPNADIQSEIILQKGDSLRSKIKQVASGRFGVTTEYLASADQIQIKISQGAKPGEGGQLPGGKVSKYIGSLRYSVPGVGLISPPPHHDIYSIEDIAQLIHDLKNVSPKADISVKLVSEIGVGTVAAGVAKAKSDHIVIAGHDGGTGASPLSSIKHAGSPWEIGLAETQQTLVINGLRNRIRLQADGQMKTGRDVVIAGLLGADEMGFATAPLVAEGCIMMRKCHLNTCPVGIATQDAELRKRFSGKPEHVVNYFFFVAEEVRQIMAQLGIFKFDDLVGNADLLETKKGLDHWKAKGLDFSRLFYVPITDKNQIKQTTTQNHGLEKALDNVLIKKSLATLNEKKKTNFKATVKNVNRTVGALLSGELIRRHPDGIEDGTLNIDMEGTGGQSFGAFLARGITLNLQGEANDYTGKGMSGGRIIVRPSPDFVGPSHDNIIVGNTVLYGATSGEAFFSGVAGERFAVRLSGAKTVIEGLGDHGCEYMTGGTVVVLGSTGRNFAAGMSGGISYVFDPNKQLEMNTNLSMVALESLMTVQEQKEMCSPELLHLGEFDEVQLRNLIEDHFFWTKSVLAKNILDKWEKSIKNFVKVFPHEYKRALGELQKSKTEGTKQLV
jgi:glutamate synthase (NADPH/NADH) large chain/glutamate synthase (ferredoxin)